MSRAMAAAVVRDEGEKPRKMMFGCRCMVFWMRKYVLCVTQDHSRKESRHQTRVTNEDINHESKLGTLSATVQFTQT
jgi:hypothetical protein